MYIEEQLEELVNTVNDLQKDIEQLKAKSTEQILTPTEFAELAQINLNTVYTWIRKGRIRTLENLGTAKRIPMSQFYEHTETAKHSSKKTATTSEELRNQFKKMRQNRIV